MAAANGAAIPPAADAGGESADVSAPVAPRLVPTATASPRFHDLDALRAFAMLMGIVLHAGLFFIPGVWAEADAAENYPAEATTFYALLFFALHGFRMHVFFLLSGFFTAMLWQKRGLRGLIVQRLKRIALPLAIGAFTVIPVTTWAFMWAFDAEGFRLSWWPFIWLSTWSHLWFLWFLLWLAAAFCAAAKLGATFTRPYVWWLALPLTCALQWLMVEPVFGPDTSDGLIPNPVVLGYYALFFAFGAFLYQRNATASRWWTLLLLPALAVFIGGLALMEGSDAAWAKPAWAVSQNAFAWLMCFGLMGLFRWLAARERRWVRYVSDSSYWLYLWHLPLIVVLYRLTLAWRLNIHLNFALLCAAATAVLLLTYQFGVRYTPIGTLLNGKRVRG